MTPHVANFDVVLSGMVEDEKTCLALYLSMERLSSFGSSLLPYTALTKLDARHNELTSVAGKPFAEGAAATLPWTYNTAERSTGMHNHFQDAVSSGPLTPIEAD